MNGCRKTMIFTSVAGAIALLAVAAPAGAYQVLDNIGAEAERRLRTIRPLEERVSGMEAAQARGDCPVVYWGFQYLSNLNPAQWEGIAPEYFEDLTRRVTAIAARGCPIGTPLTQPGTNRLALPAPPPAPAAATPVVSPVEPILSTPPEPRLTPPPVPPRRPDPIHVAPAPIPERAPAPPVTPRQPEVIHVPPAPVGQAVSPLGLPPSLEAMIRETDSQQRYLELRRLAEPGALRTRTPPLESILDDVDDAAAVETVRTCQTALQRIPPPFAAAVLAAGSRATEKPQEWYPRPDFSDTHAAADACEALDEMRSRLGLLRFQLENAVAGSLYSDSGLNYGPDPVALQAEIDQLETEIGNAGGDEAIWGLFRFGEEDVEEAVIGFQREGAVGQAEDLAGGRTEETVRTIGVEVGIDFLLGGTRAGIRAGYSEGDASGIFEVPAGPPTASGIPYNQLSPAGSTGIGASFGLDGTTEVDFSQLSLGASFRLMGPAASYRPDSVEPQAHLDLEAFYLKRDADYFLSANGGGTSGGFAFLFSDDRERHIDDHRFGLGLSGEATIPLTGNLSVRLNASAGVYHYNISLAALDHYENNFSSTPDRNFTVEISDSRNGFGYRLNGGAALEFRLGDGARLFMGVDLHHWSDVGAVSDPVSGTAVLGGQTTEVETVDTLGRYIFFGALVDF